MTYQALARKWRPRNFGELSGQEHVVRALTNALERNRLHHAYLLTGTRGVGKTTIARILAKSLNCVSGVTATPCGTCAACADIDSGRFVDLLELDAASNTGIDNMREILDNARYAPTAGRYKVYLIDEVHMLSKSAFNSMLKTLEEPPEHVKFVLATTDPQKIPVTVLSRCLQFNLKQLPVATIAGRLAAILAAEAIEGDGGALNLVARAAQGSMRDALSLLDQAIAYGGGEVREDVVRTMLGAVDSEHPTRIVDALLARDGAALLAECAAMAGRNVTFASALEELASLLHRIAVVQAVPGTLATMDDAERIGSYAEQFAPEEVQLAYEICVRGRADLALAPDEATGFSMTLLRLLAFEPGVRAGQGSAPGTGRPVPNGRALPRTATAGPDGAGAARAGSAAPRGVGGPGTLSSPASSPVLAANAAGATASLATGGSAIVNSPTVNSSTVNSSTVNSSTAGSTGAATVGAPQVAAPAAEPAPSAPVSRVEATSGARPAADAIPAPPGAGGGAPAGEEGPASDGQSLPQSPAQWRVLVAGLKLAGMAGQLAAQTEWRRAVGRELVLAIPEAQRHLAERAYAEKLRSAIEATLGGRLRLTFETIATAEASLAAQERRERAEQKAKSEATFREEPFVRDVLARFDARIKPDSVKPASEDVTGTRSPHP
ncbi:MAG: DNA polymerase III subunit gamma/tau [Casimicrobiaceae bacterium]